MAVYTIPNRPAGGDARSIGPVLANFDALLAALNSFDGANIQDGTVLAAALADAAKLGLTGGGVTRRGKAIISAEEVRTNVAYGLMPTPDRVQSVVLPTDGLIVVHYNALWKHNLSGVAPSAAIFLGGNQIQARAGGGNRAVQQATAHYTNPAVNGVYQPLVSFPLGLAALYNETVASSDDVVTGQSTGLYGLANLAFSVGALDVYNTLAGSGGAPCYIFAAAGTYDVSVQFKNPGAGGNVTVKNRRLLVHTIGF